MWKVVLLVKFVIKLIKEHQIKNTWMMTKITIIFYMVVKYRLRYNHTVVPET